jgi:hypothetical protein
MLTYTLAVDVWEGSLDIEEQILWDAGVRAIIVRLNNMNGGHHLDANFQAQWDQAANFLRWPYFVYNPWVNARANFDWLRAHMPKEATHVMLDIEVKPPENYAAVTYAADVQKFVDMVTAAWSFDIYTGGWFISYLSKWPSERYTWARYPYTFYPANTTRLSWADLHSKIRATSWNPGNTVGTCQLWQISADRFILPGCAERPMDIVVFNGDETALRQYIAYQSRPDYVADILARMEQRQLDQAKDLTQLKSLLGK